jgi:hypothetical protein
MLTTEQRDEFLGTLYNPRYINPEHTGAILLDGVFNGQKMTFYASPLDPMEYGRKIYERVIAGEYGEIREFGD